MFKVGRNLASRFSAPSSNIHLLSTELRVGGDSAVSEGNWGGGHHHFKLAGGDKRLEGLFI